MTKAANLDAMTARVATAQGLRLGIVGFGRLAQIYYVPAVARAANVRAVLVADPLESSRAAASRLLPNARILDDADTLLGEGPDAILVASPPSSHLAIWNTSSAAGIPVFMEKPFVMAGQLAAVNRSEAARLLLMPDFNRRFWPLYQELRSRAGAGAVGSIRAINLEIEVDIRPWLAVTAHRLSPDDGGLLHDLGSQAIDFLCHIHGGKVAKLTAVSQTHIWADDRLQLKVEFDDGVIGECQLGYGKRTHERASVVGESGRLFVPDPNMTLHVETVGSDSRFSVGARDVAALAYRGMRRSHSMLRYTVRAAIERFLRSCTEGAAFEPGFNDAARNTKLIEDVKVSLDRGESVKVDDR